MSFLSHPLPYNWDTCKLWLTFQLRRIQQLFFLSQLTWCKFSSRNNCHALWDIFIVAQKTLLYTKKSHWHIFTLQSNLNFKILTKQFTKVKRHYFFLYHVFFLSYLLCLSFQPDGCLILLHFLSNLNVICIWKNKRNIYVFENKTENVLLNSTGP